MAKSMDVFELLKTASTGQVETVRKLVHGSTTPQLQVGQRESSISLHAWGGDPTTYLEATDSTNKTALWLAVERENALAVKTLVRAGADVNKSHDSRRTPLILAAEKENPELVQVLIDAGAKLDAVDSFGMSALMVSAAKGRLECLNKLVCAGADLELRDIRRKTALMIAVEEDKPECMQRLVKAGADLACLDSRKMSPLMVAVSKGHDRCVRTLVQEGARVDERDSKDRSPLMVSVEEGSILCLQELIQAGADVDLVDRQGRTAVMMASRGGRVETLLSLIQAGANLDIADDEGWTALMMAADAGAVECVDILVRNGARVNVGDKKGKTALMLATIKGHHSCVQSLLKAESPGIDVLCRSGKTALMYASENLSEECLQALVRAGADLNMTDARGKTALMCVIYETLKGARTPEIQEEGVRRCVQILLSAGADVNLSDRDGKTALMYAATSSKSGCFLESLVNAGVDVHYLDKRGQSALTHAAVSGNLECIRRLVVAGASVNIRDNSGKCLLHHLARHYDELRAVQCMEILLAHQADVAAKDEDGMTALMHAAKFSASTHIAAFLIGHGAEVNAVNNSGGSALVLSLGLDLISLERVSFLLSKGANPNIGTVTGKSAVALAVHFRHFDLLRLLVENGAQLNMDWEDFRHLLGCGERKMLQFLVVRGLVPSGIVSPEQCQASFVNRYSALVTALSSGHVDMAKFFMAASYLNIHDVIWRPPEQHISDVNTRLLPRWYRSQLSSDSLARAFLSHVHLHPWPLVKLCFVAVSAALGPSPGRQERVQKSQLPVVLQRMLLHGERVDRLCVRHWGKIPLCFSPEEYDKLPKPRPLLYYWPFGRDLVPCDCEGCGHEGYKFVD